MKKKRMNAERKPPIKIPMDFDSAVGGLLAVDPKKVKAAEEKRKKKLARKKKRAN